MKAIKIDVTNQTIEQVEIGDDLQSIYDQIGNGCNLFEVANYIENDCVYVDEEGLFHDNIGGFCTLSKNGIPQNLLVGNGLIVGTDNNGFTVDVEISVKDLKKRIRFFQPEQLESYFEQFN